MPRGRILALVGLVALLCALTACATNGTARSSGRPSRTIKPPTTTPPIATAPTTTPSIATAPTTTPPTTTPRMTTAAPTHTQPAPRRAQRTHQSPHSPDNRTALSRPKPSAARPARPTSPARRPAPPSTRTAPAPRTGTALPLDGPTGDATQVLTVVAGAKADTRGVLQAWRRGHGGWRRVGPALLAWLGTAGMTPHPRETLSAAPMGSWTLTRAFGRDPDPGTRLAYTRTTPADWWISQPGPLYNTFQRCASSCGFTQGSPNEHLYYVAPQYDYAVVIDYNTRNAGSVRQGAGSAFFLHVSAGEPTAGCVAIDGAALVRIMRWLDPADDPRILIGTR